MLTLGTGDFEITGNLGHASLHAMHGDASWDPLIPSPPIEGPGLRDLTRKVLMCTYVYMYNQAPQGTGAPDPV